MGAGLSLWGAGGDFVGDFNQLKAITITIFESIFCRIRGFGFYYLEQFDKNGLAAFVKNLGGRILAGGSGCRTYLLYNIPRKSRRPKSAARGAFVLSGVQHVTSLLGQWAMGDLAYREK